MDRCVHCGYDVGAHTNQSLNCVGTAGRQGRTFASMVLPNGKTCGDCKHFKPKCEWLISCKTERTQCDWWPIRFVQIEA